MRKNCCIPASYLIVENQNKLLLLKRRNTGYRDGEYGLIAGHVEAGESFTQCIIREAREEAGLVITADDLEVAHILYRVSDFALKDERIDTFFRLKTYLGGEQNMEPEKCAELTWFDRDALPENTIPYIRKVLTHVQNHQVFSESGFPVSKADPVPKLEASVTT